MVVKFFKFIWEYFKINLQSAIEYKANFITQSTFMILNNLIWIIFWMIFFSKFPTLNEWGMKEMMIMMATISFSWGLVGVFFGNFRYLAEVIREGQLDFYLTLPKEELTHILISKSKFEAFGDVLFGLVLALIAVPVWKLPLFFFLCINSCVIILGFAIILGSLSFYIGSAVEASSQGLMGILSIASYPFSAFNGYTKFILLTLIPAGFITGVPVNLIRNFSWTTMISMSACAIIIICISIIIFKRGIRKYESGNLINARI